MYPFPGQPEPMPQPSLDMPQWEALWNALMKLRANPIQPGSRVGRWQLPKPPAPQYGGVPIASQSQPKWAPPGRPSWRDSYSGNRL